MELKIDITIGGVHISSATHQWLAHKIIVLLGLEGFTSENSYGNFPFYFSYSIGLLNVLQSRMSESDVRKLLWRDRLL